MGKDAAGGETTIMDTGDKAHENVANVLEDISKEARLTGFISITGLAMILGNCAEYSDLLPVLWKEYGLDNKENNLIPRKDYDTQEGTDRAAMWYFLLLRWTHSDGGMFRKLGQSAGRSRRKIINLPLYRQQEAGGEWMPVDGGKGEDLNLKEFESYLQNEIYYGQIDMAFFLPERLYVSQSKSGANHEITPESSHKNIREEKNTQIQASNTEWLTGQGAILRYLGIESSHTLTKYRESGLPVYKTAGLLRADPKELDEWVKRNSTK